MLGRLFLFNKNLKKMALPLIIPQLLGGALSNADTLAGIFSSDYRDDQIELAQQQNQATANNLALQSQQRQTPNYTMFIVIGIAILVAIYFFTRKK